MKTQVYVGVDLGGTNLKAGLVTASGRILERVSLPVQAERGGIFVLHALLHIIGKMFEIAKVRRIHIGGIGVGTPGAVEAREGCVCYGAGNLPGWKGIPFMKEIRKQFRKRTFAHNDATLAALAEARFGFGKKVKNLICITLGTGIGGGIIINGKIYEGVVGYAGEFGHMKIVPNGRHCTCGAKGCWEAYSSASGLLARAREVSKNKKSSKLYKMLFRSKLPVGAKEIYKLARAGDQLALRVVEEMGEYLGLGLANLVNIFNPEMVILSGGISRDRLIKPSLLESFRKNALGLSRKHVTIKISRFTHDMGVLGAAAWAMDSLGVFGSRSKGAHGV